MKNLAAVTAGVFAGPPPPTAVCIGTGVRGCVPDMQAREHEALNGKCRHRAVDAREDPLQERARIHPREHSVHGDATGFPDVSPRAGTSPSKSSPHRNSVTSGLCLSATGR